MVLAIDIGNTHIVVGCFQKDRIVFVERISTNRTNTTLEYAVSFKTILEIYQIPVSEIEGNIIASVVPSVTNTVKRAVETITKQETLLVGPGIKTGLHITIDNPAQLGSNLVVTAVAALHTYQAPIAVIDMGTATTISVINKQEEYVGGMILPGVGISLAALTEKTSLLQTIDLQKPKKMIATKRAVRKWGIWFQPTQWTACEAVFCMEPPMDWTASCSKLNRKCSNLSQRLQQAA